MNREKDSRRNHACVGALTVMGDMNKQGTRVLPSRSGIDRWEGDVLNSQGENRVQIAVREENIVEDENLAQSLIEERLSNLFRKVENQPLMGDLKAIFLAYRIGKLRKC